MKFDAPLSGLPLVEVRQRAAELEQLSFDGVWGDECQHAPFLPMLKMVLGTEKLQFGTNIAIAFARAILDGDDRVGLAQSQRRASSTRSGHPGPSAYRKRFSTTFDHPAARVTDYIHCL